MSEEEDFVKTRFGVGSATRWIKTCVIQIKTAAVTHCMASHEPDLKLKFTMKTTSVRRGRHHPRDGNPPAEPRKALAPG
jgi:hypothetical protein